MATPRVAAAAPDQPSEAAANQPAPEAAVNPDDQEPPRLFPKEVWQVLWAIIGRDARFAFWQTMWFPLVAFLFAGHGPEVNRLRYINVMFMVVYQGGLSAWLFFKTRNNLRAADAVDKWARFAAYVGGVPNMACRSILKPFLFGDEKWEGMGATKAAYEDILTNAALTILIFLYFLRFVDEDWKGRMISIFFYFILMIHTTLAVYQVTESGLVEIGSLVVYFKTAALVALICCAPHLYPGLSPRRSLVVVSSFILAVLPLAWAAVWLLQQYEVADNDTILAKVDDYKYHLGAVYLMLYGCEAVVVWADGE